MSQVELIEDIGPDFEFDYDTELDDVVYTDIDTNSPGGKRIDVRGDSPAWRRIEEYFEIVIVNACTY